MLSSLLAVAVLAAVAAAAPEVMKRQATDPAEFTSAVNQLISVYIPPSVGIPIGVAIQSAAAASGVTGDINALVQSALAAPTPPPYLTAVPSQYQPNLVSLESAINALRGVASTGIPGAPILSVGPLGVETIATKDVVTTTNADGHTIVAVTLPTTDAHGSTVPAVVNTLSSFTGPTGPAHPSASQPTGAFVTTNSQGSTITGLAVTTADASGSIVTSLTTTFPPVGPSSVSSGSSAASSSAAAIAPSSASSSVGTTTTATQTSSAPSSAASSSTTGAGTSTSTVTSTSGSPAPSSSSSSKGAGAPMALAPGVGGLAGLLALALAL
ncbi:MAG: hypothetical protein M1826_001231 [Phylliscum demangeonii]|nr:MAG: hypothetical protein M1826_001231 [Phylliscum demangeonii]